MVMKCVNENLQCYFKSGIIPVPNCKLCNQLQVLVVQLYCPLEGFAYDRIIQVFACTRKCCWNKSKRYDKKH